MTSYTLLQFPDRLVLVSDEEVTDCYFANGSVGKKDTNGWFPPDIGALKVIAGHGSLPSVDVTAIAETIGWVDADFWSNVRFPAPRDLSTAQANDNIIRNQWATDHHESAKKRFGYKEGFNKAQDLNKNKFTEEDMLRFARITSGRDQLPNGWTSNSPDYVLTRLSEEKQHPKQWRVEVEEELTHVRDNTDTRYAAIPRITNNTIKVTKVIEQ